MKHNDNVIDLSGLLNSLPSPIGDDQLDLGRPERTITISGTWDGGRPTCEMCRQQFTPGPEGAAILTHAALGSFYPVCHDCAAPYVV